MNLDWQRLAPPLVAAAAAFAVWRRTAAAAAPRRRRAEISTAYVLPWLAGLAGALWLWRDGRPWLAVAAMATGHGLMATWREIAQRRHDATRETEAIEAIGAANRALRAGMPLLAVIDAAAREATGDAQAALREVLHRERLGEDLAAALHTVMQDVRQPELRTFGMALAVNQDVGGNLVATSERLTRAVLDRSRTRRRARTIVAYARSAALALAILPCVAVVVLGQMVPGYLKFVFDTKLGNAMLAIAVVLMALGMRSMQRLAQFEAARKPRAAA